MHQLTWTPALSPGHSIDAFGGTFVAVVGYLVKDVELIAGPFDDASVVADLLRVCAEVLDRVARGEKEFTVNHITEASEGDDYSIAYKYEEAEDDA